MKHTIKGKFNTVWTVDEENGESEFRNSCPTFFRHPHGQRETFEAYRGFLIVRCTATFDRQKVRKTTLYLFDTDSKDTSCLGSDFSNANGAKKYVDKILAAGKYE